MATRFPPEPNGYLHIGHAKSICLNFGLAEEFGGSCNLRFDDTNPVTEEVEYVEAIANDVRWLGFSYGERPLFGSDSFGLMFELAKKLIREGKAYVCALNEEEIRAYRGTLQEPGRPSPWRDRPVDESLRLFDEMNEGKHPEGSLVLRAKIDMAASNMKMRDPLLYRIKRAAHHRTGTAWNVYPMYDYAHPLEDAVERITHSICTLEFENNRELYDWVIRETAYPWVPRQYEFARLNLDYTITSKRKLLQLVEKKLVNGWDDPRMPTIAGMRRRGYTPEAVRSFCELIGVAKNNSVVDIGKLEFAVRDDMNRRAPRVMAVLRPLRVTLTNVPEGETEWLEGPYFPADVPEGAAMGGRKIPLSRDVFIEADDFREAPSKDYLRLAPGRVVRLRYGYCVRCEGVTRDAEGRVVGVTATLLRETLGGAAPAGEKVWGVLHWVSAAHALEAEVRVYDRLFAAARPDAYEDFTRALNPRSLEVISGARVEPSVAADGGIARYQFERVGYFYRDPVDCKEDRLVFNKIVGLKETAVADLKPLDDAAPVEALAAKSSKSETRPAGRTRAQLRQLARDNTPVLNEKRAHFERHYGLSSDESDLVTASLSTVGLVEEAIAAGAAAKSVARWVINELPRELGERDVSETKLVGAALGALIVKADDGTLTATVARALLATLVRDGGDVSALIAREGGRLDAAALDEIVTEVLGANADKVAQYRAGKTALAGFFVGQVMKAAKGKAEASAVQGAVQRALG